MERCRDSKEGNQQAGWYYGRDDAARMRVGALLL